MAKLDKKLVLNSWILEKFGAKSVEDFKVALDDESLVGFTEDGYTKYFGQLELSKTFLKNLDKESLIIYDENIVRHWKKITKNRRSGNKHVFPLYFQYLALLFTEYYLDRYLGERDQLLDELNEYLTNFNIVKKLKNKEVLEPFIEKDLNKIAYWIATGGGKTLLMHVNIEQFKYYLHKHDRHSSFNRIILLTPNEGLSRQHEKEFLLSDMSAELFNPSRQDSLFTSEIDIIDIHKLKEKKGEKTVAIESFEANNLVLVDEGHRGASGDDWLSKRNAVCEDGFSFEYSATFGQAIKAAPKAKQLTLSQLYSKCILFDYSYKYFHKDGYGKDHKIYNLEEEKLDQQRQLYLTACLLSFFEQKAYFSNNVSSLTDYMLQNPLWIFVGGSVSGQRAQNELTDIQQIILFFARFVENKSNQSVKDLEKLLTKKDDLRSKNNKPVFDKLFIYILQNYKLNEGKKLFDDILQAIFNTSTIGLLHLSNLRGVDGEIGLHVGGNSYFGVINIGDTSSFLKICRTIEGENLLVEEKSYQNSLFHEINSSGSKINLLIGAKKFTEGWSSWRVSTMGLMNVGRSEGSEIIQLFGRGIRLKGYNFSLKRSGYVDAPSSTHPENITILETLNVFGVKSSYMEEFEDYLKEEGVEQRDYETIILPVIREDLPDDLHVIKPDDDLPDFKKSEKPHLTLDIEKMTKSVVLNWYPKIQSKQSKGAGLSDAQTLNEGKLNPAHLAFLDFDKLYFDLLDYKNEKARYNVQITREEIKNIICDSRWYTLYIPEYTLDVKSFKAVSGIQEIAISLLKKYFEKFYQTRKSEYESPHLKYYKLKSSDPNFIKEYKAVVDSSETIWISKIKEMSEVLSDTNKLNDMGYPFEYSTLKVFNFDKHLYEPLVRFTNNEVVKISPVAMNDGEHDFIEDLKSFWEKEKIDGVDLFLLRNQSRQGIGFFEAGNFYPDFILWVKKDKTQYMSFVDPKGLRHIHGFNDPKISFHKVIKTIQERLNNDSIKLNSFIISNTSRADINWWCDGSDDETKFSSNHVLFQEDSNYIGKMFNILLSENELGNA